MPSVDWYVEGELFGGCNCDWGCPCQFESLPTHGNCTGFEAMRIDHGRFGEVSLDGLKEALFYAWPGPIFKGNGEILAVIDENADAEQRKALGTILYGGETEHAKTHWWVFHAMSSIVHDPLFRPIEFKIDIEARAARVVIPGIFEAIGRPIRSRATGAEHRVRIDLPNAIAIKLNEIGMSTATSTGPIKFDFADGFGQFGVLRTPPAGARHRN